VTSSPAPSAASIAAEQQQKADVVERIVASRGRIVSLQAELDAASRQHAAALAAADAAMHALAERQTAATSQAEAAYSQHAATVAWLHGERSRLEGVRREIVRRRQLLLGSTTPVAADASGGGTARQQPRPLWDPRYLQALQRELVDRHAELQALQREVQ
jgi:hypothetical protein